MQVYHIDLCTNWPILIKSSRLSKPWQKFRGVKPGTTAGRKRKAPDELSTNQNTMKARNRMNAMSPACAQNADRQAVRRALISLKASMEWKGADSTTRGEMEQQREQEVMATRYFYLHCVEVKFILIGTDPFGRL